jgi:hypothetical protein
MGMREIVGTAGDGGSLLPDRTRRDVADLNGLYLDRAVEPLLAGEPWFALPRAVAERFARAGRGARDLAAQSPVALFELVLPPATDWHRLGSVVTDGAASRSPAAELLEVRRAFGLAALGFARRLAEAVPLAARLVFGLARHDERLLVDLTLSDAFHVAAWPGLVRPRWSSHPAYWAALATAAAEESTAALRWLHATSLCLDPRTGPAAPVETARGRRSARLVRRRTGSARADVPC